MLTHMHTISTLCGEQLGSKGEAAEEIEKKKEVLVNDRTLARLGPDSDQAASSQCVALG